LLYSLAQCHLRCAVLDPQSTDLLSLFPFSFDSDYLLGYSQLKGQPIPPSRRDRELWFSLSSYLFAAFVPADASFDMKIPPCPKRSFCVISLSGTPHRVIPCRRNSTSLPCRIVSYHSCPPFSPPNQLAGLLLRLAPPPLNDDFPPPSPPWLDRFKTVILDPSGASPFSFSPVPKHSHASPTDACPLMIFFRVSIAISLFMAPKPRANFFFPNIPLPLRQFSLALFFSGIFQALVFFRGSRTGGVSTLFSPPFKRGRWRETSLSPLPSKRARRALVEFLRVCSIAP